MPKNYYLIPRPRYIETVSDKSGLRLSKLLMIFLNKHKIRDSALKISSRFYKFFGVFLETYPIKDTYNTTEEGDKNYFAVITTEDTYFGGLKDRIDSLLPEKVKFMYKLSEDVAKKTAEEIGDPKRMEFFRRMFIGEGYYIEIKNETAWIISPSRRGFAYGVRTFVKMINSAVITHSDPNNYIVLPETKILDFPLIELRAFHIDLKRLMPTFGALESLLDFLADMYYNTVVVEYEDKFPYTGKLAKVRHRYAFTPSELKRFLDTCALYYLDVIPLIQVFGHLETWLMKPSFSELRESAKPVENNVHARALCPLKKASEDFIFEMIDQICEAHPDSDYVHIGCDEVWELGTCPKCSEYVRKNSLSALYIEWVNKAAERVLKHGKKPIIWSDFLIRYPEELDRLNRNVIVCYWDYRSYRDPEKTLWVDRVVKSEEIPKTLAPHYTELYEKYYIVPGYPKYVKLLPFYEFFIDRGFGVIGAPSVASDFRTLLPDMFRGINNVTAHAERCCSSRASGILVTSWPVCGDPWDTQIFPIFISAEGIHNFYKLGRYKPKENDGFISDPAYDPDYPPYDFDWEYIDKAMALTIFECVPESFSPETAATVYSSIYDSGPDINNDLYRRKLVEHVKKHIKEGLTEIYDNHIYLRALSIGLELRKNIFDVRIAYGQLGDLLHKIDDLFDNFFDRVLCVADGKSSDGTLPEFPLTSADLHILGNVVSVFGSAERDFRLIGYEAKDIFITSGKRLMEGELDFIFDKPYYGFSRLYLEFIPPLAEALENFIEISERIHKNLDENITDPQVWKLLREEFEEAAFKLSRAYIRMFL